MRVAVIGAGYVGLVTGACLADQGHDVTVVDLDAAKVDAVNGGRAPIHERSARLLRVSGSNARARPIFKARWRSDVVLIAGGTPPKAEPSTSPVVEGLRRG
jgi:UDP-glucose 6-dehydrogenase